MNEISIEPKKLLNMANALEAGLELKNRRYGFRIYHESFLGSEAVTFLVSNKMADTRQQAVQIGRAMAKTFNLFNHVTRDHLLKDKYLFTGFRAKTSVHRG